MEVLYFLMLAIAAVLAGIVFWFLFIRGDEEVRKRIGRFLPRGRNAATRQNTNGEEP